MLAMQNAVADSPKVQALRSTPPLLITSAAFTAKVAVIKAKLIQDAAQFRRGQRQRVSLERDRLLTDDGMERKLNIVRDVRVSEFRERSFDGDVLPKAPAFEGVIGNDFDERAQSPACGFLPILRVMENGFDQHALERIDGWVAHCGQLVVAAHHTRKAKDAHGGHVCGAEPERARRPCYTHA